MIAPFVTCEIGPGLRELEAQVTVHDLSGRKHRLRVPRDFLRRENDSWYLPIGIVASHPNEAKLLIEFPHEADSGANRCWVHPAQLLTEPQSAESPAPPPPDPVWGLMADDPELVDAMLAEVYQARETHPLRLPVRG